MISGAKALGIGSWVFEVEVAVLSSDLETRGSRFIICAGAGVKGLFLLNLVWLK